MKTNAAVLQIAAVVSAVALFGRPAFSQPGVIDPVTGIPNPASKADGSKPRQAGAFDPANGLPITTPIPGELTPENAVDLGNQTANAAKKLIFNGRYEEALQSFLAYHNQFKTSGALTWILNDWVELSRRYPKAKAALLEIRDHDAKEFSEGRGFWELFMEIHTINQAMHDEDSTYDVFMSFRDTDPVLAQQCYGLVEGLLVAKGDYQWCYDHMGDPHDKLGAIQQRMTWLLDAQKRVAESNQRIQQQLAELHRQRGFTNRPPGQPLDHAASGKKAAEANFVNESRNLIEILVATGHKSEAKKIRDEALKMVDDERLKTSVEDAIQKVQKQSPTSGGRKA